MNKNGFLQCFLCPGCMWFTHAFVGLLLFVVLVFIVPHFMAVTGDENLFRIAVADAAGSGNVAAWLGSIGAPAVPLLLENLKHPHDKVRSLAATALGSMDSPPKEAVAALVEALQDSDPEVRKSAASALRVIDPAAAESAKAGEIGHAQPQDAELPAASEDRATATDRKPHEER